MTLLFQRIKQLRIVSLRAADQLDFVLHVGDISYADMDQRLWDEFMRLVEPISGRGLFFFFFLPCLFVFLFGFVWLFSA